MNNSARISESDCFKSQRALLFIDRRWPGSPRVVENGGELFAGVGLA
jgi:hypothetical protein